MDTATITQLIGNLGFPIFVSVFLIYFLQVQQKSMLEAIGKLSQSISDLQNQINLLINKEDKKDDN